MALSNYLVKMSDTYRSPPKRITLPRKVITADNIAKSAKYQQCYHLRGGITEIFSLLRAENDNQLCNSRLRGAGERISLATVCKDPHRPHIFADLALKIRAECAVNELT